MAIKNLVKKIFLCALSASASAACLLAHGERLGMPESARVTADFVDADGDGVDDRYQQRHSRRSAESPPPLTPVVECLGSRQPGGAAAVQMGIILREEWWRLSRSMPSRLSPLRHAVFPGHPDVDKFLRGEVSGLKFTFPDGIIIYAAEEGVPVVVFSGEGYRAFEWMTSRPPR